MVEILYKDNYCLIYGQTKSFDIFQQDIIVQQHQYDQYDINHITSFCLNDEDTLRRELEEKFIGKTCTLEYYQKAKENPNSWKSGEFCPILQSLKVHGLKKPK